MWTKLRKNERNGKESKIFNFILQARAMGFDTLIMGMRDADALRRLFAIPETETVMAVIALGYRDAEPSRPEHRPLEEIAKFF